MVAFYVQGIYVLSSATISGMFLRPHQDGELQLEFSQDHSILEKLAFLTIATVGHFSQWQPYVVLMVTLCLVLFLLVHILHPHHVHCSSDLSRALKVWSYLTGIVFALLGIIAEAFSVGSDIQLANILSAVGCMISALLLIFCMVRGCQILKTNRVAMSN